MFDESIIAIQRSEAVQGDEQSSDTMFDYVGELTELEPIFHCR